MREILFRGKRTDNGEWVEGYFGIKRNRDKEIYCVMCETVNSNYDETYFTDYEVIPETVGQYTGLHDAAGTEIFEGDIVCVPREDELLQIEWDEDTARFIMRASTFMCDFDNYWGYECDVIGNIHDNPELLDAT